MTDILKYLKAKCLEWACYVWRADESLVCSILVMKLNKKRPRRKPYQRCIDRIAKDKRSGQ